ncbi:MAG: DUF4240 domain-containing protein [Saprospiraceae bacterium]
MLNKLLQWFFRRKPEGTEELMDENKFWALIQASKAAGKGDYEKQKIELVKLLLKQKPKEIAAFDNRFRYTSNQLYHWDLWGAIYIIDGGCSDDGFDYFREWLIGQGKEMVETAMNNPDALADFEIERDTDWEGLGFMAYNAFYYKTGADLYQGYLATIPFELKGEEWSEDNDDLERRFPRLFEKYKDQY